MGWIRTKDTTLIGRVFTFECVPSGLFTRLLTRAFHIARVLVFWRHGLLLRYEGAQQQQQQPAQVMSPQQQQQQADKNATLALVESSLQQIRIYIRGPDAGFLLAALV